MSRRFLRSIVLALATGFISASAEAEMNQFSLFSQHDWSAKQGVFLLLDNNYEKNQPSKIGDLRINVGVANGKDWVVFGTPPGLQFGRDYAVKCVLDTSHGELWLDGKLIQRVNTAFTPSSGSPLANDAPEWAHGPADYMVLQKSLKLTSAGRLLFSQSFEAEASRPTPMLLFQPTHPIHPDVHLKAPVTIETTFRLVPTPDLNQLAPFVDPYGQSVHAQWPGKVKSDQDLKATLDGENRRYAQWGDIQGYDQFGGYTQGPWKEKPTGFFRVTQRDGLWWLITPEGNPCFYRGLCTPPGLDFPATPVGQRQFLFQSLPPKDGPYTKAWLHNCWGGGEEQDYLAFQDLNLLRKYGSNWRDEAAAITTRRIKAWGFSGIGKWSDMPGFAHVPVLKRDGVPTVARHPDVFNPDVRSQFRNIIRQQVEPHRNSPFVIGWSLGNEFDESVLKTEIQDILKKGSDIPAKRALVDFAIDTIYAKDPARLASAWKASAQTRDALYAAPLEAPANEVERLRHFYADAYFSFVYRTIKEIDPNHLYFGFWVFPGLWENENDWRWIAPHCDVIGYDSYTYDFADAQLLALMKETNKPVLCGEFSFPAWYDGKRGFGFFRSSVKDDAASGEYYTRWLKAAATNPFCVGTFWFEYRDQPITGRGPGQGPQLVHGEHYAFGLVDVTDTPKWDLIERMRQANLDATSWRLSAGSKPVGDRVGSETSQTPPRPQ